MKKFVLLFAVVGLVAAGSATAAFIHGTPGDDTIAGTPHSDVIEALAGNDTVHAGSGADVVYGGKGNDSLWGGRGQDRLYGGPGDDVLHALADDNQRDLLDCGPGNDVAWVNVKDRGLYRIVNCETVNWIVPTPDQAAQENAG
jgi:Ca2+-binding RTX toxin-like protein